CTLSLHDALPIWGFLPCRLTRHLGGFLLHRQQPGQALVLHRLHRRLASPPARRRGSSSRRSSSDSAAPAETSAITSLHAGPSRHRNESVLPDLRLLHHITVLRRMDHLAVSDVNRHVMNCLGVALCICPEDQVTGL